MCYLLWLTVFVKDDNGPKAHCVCRWAWLHNVDISGEQNYSFRRHTCDPVPSAHSEAFDGRNEHVFGVVGHYTAEGPGELPPKD